MVVFAQSSEVDNFKVEEEVSHKHIVSNIGGVSGKGDCESLV
jgi:hypothetical protein